MKEGMIQPNSIEVENIVLGTLMTERGAFDEVRELLTDDCFYNAENRRIFSAIKSIVQRGDRADVLTVNEELKKTGGIDLLTLVSMSAQSTFDLYQHAAILFDKSRRRRFIEIGTFLITNGYSETEDIVDVATHANERLNDLFNNSQNNTEKIDDVIVQVMEQINRNTVGECSTLGTPTGFNEFDRKSGGLNKSDLIIIAGETSQGKTSLALSMMTNAALSGASIAIYSLEMRNTQLVSRMMAAVSGIPSTTISYKPFNDDQYQQLDCAIGGISRANVFFDDRGTSNIDTIISGIRSMKKKYNIDGVLIDYLQILNVNMKGMNQEQQMGDVSRRLKNLAKELDIWVVALSQLSRNQDNPEPSMSRLRASGQIAEAADVVCLVYRPEEYGRRFPDPFSDRETRGTAMLDFSKGRNIGTLKMLCGFDSHTTRFYDLCVPESTRPDFETIPF